MRVQILKLLFMLFFLNWHIFALDFNRSDVFVTYDPKNIDLVNNYFADGVMWGRPPMSQSASETINWHKEVEAIHANGSKYTARIEFDAYAQGFNSYATAANQYAILDVDGNTINYPWFGTVWYSSYAPKYIEWLKKQISYALDGNPDYLMIDAQTSSALSVIWYGGDFSSWSLDGFNDFLKSKYTTSELSVLGIDDVNNFNYRTYLKSKGYNKSSYMADVKKSPATIPLIEDWKEYHTNGLKKLIEELVAFTDSSSNGTVPVSVSCPIADPERAVFSKKVAFYVEELGQQADFADPIYMEPFEGTPFKPILSYKIAEALDKNFVCTALPDPDWIEIKNTNRQRQVQSWIAQAYANGANFMAPVKEWAYGNEWFQPDYNNYDFIYDFIKTNTRLFDGYKADSKVGLLYSQNGRRFNSYMSDMAVAELTNENIPFDLIVVDDAMGHNMLTQDELDKYDVIVVGYDSDYMSDETKTLINNNGNKIVYGTDRTKIVANGGVKIETSIANNKVTVLPRKNKENSSYVIHFVNRIYDKSNDKMVGHGDFKVTVKKSIVDKDILAVKVYAPNRDVVNLPIIDNGDNIEFTVPSIDFWSIVELQLDSSTAVKRNIINNRNSIYPNPVIQTLNIAGKLKKDWVLFSINGNRIATGNKKSISLKNIKCGAYKIKINDKFYTFVKTE